MLKKVAFTMYPVKDMDRALSFYKDNLGLVPSNLFSNGGWVEYDLPHGGCFAITTLATGVEPSSVSGGSIAFEVDDLDALVASLKAKNVTLKRDIFHSPVCRMAVILDSEGNAITLHQLNKKPALAKNQILPEDILPEDANYAQINGANIRKGTVAAVLANIGLLEQAATDKDRQSALQAIKPLVPALIALGLGKYVEWKNPAVQALINEELMK